MDRIVAITVTFNDYDYLEKSLCALRKQTIQIHKIVVVDNCSNEENKRKLLIQQNEQTDILWLNENKGGAGGFEEGMRYAREQYDPDWYWLMDADAYPREDCAEKLLAHKAYCDDIGILAPLIYGIDLKEYQFYHHKRMSRFLYRDIQIYHSYDEISDVSFIEADAFVGPMISKRAVKDVGIANGSLFIYGDDVEYTYRVFQKYRILLVRDAVMMHRDQPVNGVQNPNNWWKDYYTFRNRVQFVKEYNKNTIACMAGLCLLCLRLIKELIRTYRMPYFKSMKRMRRRLLIQGMRDGISGIGGKTVDPLAFKEKIKQLEEYKGIESNTLKRKV